MALTQVQLTTLKTDMHSAPRAALGAFLTAEDWPSVAVYYNAPSGSTVWRPAIPVADLSRNIIGSAFDALTVQKQNGYIALTQGGVVNATFGNIRNWFSDIFGAGSATLIALTAEAQRPATRFELLFSTVAAPANVTTVFGQMVSDTECHLAELFG
jgi:hypothetical protein